MLESIFAIIIDRATTAGYVPALKRTRKSNKKKIKQSKMAQRKYQEDNYELVEGSVYSTADGFENFY